MPELLNKKKKDCLDALTQLVACDGATRDELIEALKDVRAEAGTLVAVLKAGATS